MIVAAEVIQFLGTLVTIAGLVVVAPFQAGKLLPDVGRWFATRAREIRGLLARFLPFLRPRPITAHLASGTLHLTASAPTAWMYGNSWPPEEAPVGEQIAATRRAIENLQGQVDRMRVETAEQIGRLEQRVSSIDHQNQVLRESIELDRRERERLDGRGFPLTAVGAFLAGVPSEWLIAAGWWLIGVALTVGVIAAGIACMRLWDSRERLREGLRAYQPPASQTAG